MRALLVGLLVLLPLASISLAENPTFLGEEPPAFGFGPWANTVLPYKTLDEFAGEVVVLEFLRTSCPGCRAVMPALDKTWREHDRPDVHVFCVTNDSVELTQRFLVHEGAGRKLGYPITTGCNQSFGVTQLPWTYVIGRDGKVVWAGHSGRSYGKALAAAVKADDPQRPEAPANLRKACKRIVEAKYQKALELAEKALASEETRAFGEYVAARVQTHFERELATVDLHLKRGDVFSACELLDAMRSRFAGTTFLETIEERHAAVEAMDGFAAAADAWKRYHAAWASARKSKAGVAQACKKLEGLKAGDVPSAAKAAEALLDVLGNPWTLADAANFGGCSN